MLLAKGDLTGNEAKSLIKFFTQVQNFNRGLDISEKLFINKDKENLDKVYGRNKLYAEKLSGELFSEVSNILERKDSFP